VSLLSVGVYDVEVYDLADGQLVSFDGAHGQLQYIERSGVAAVGRACFRRAFAWGRVGGDVDDVVAGVHPEDVEADLAVVHPVGVAAGLVVDEEHAASGRERGAAHEAVFALGVGGRELHVDGRAVGEHEQGGGRAGGDPWDDRLLGADGERRQSDEGERQQDVREGATEGLHRGDFTGCGGV
jgi:hypothetical protein